MTSEQVYVSHVQPTSLVVTDLDGTLWPHRQPAPPSTRAALATLESLGVPLLAATGRRVSAALRGFAEADLTPLPVVGLNGAVGVAGGAIFHAATFSANEARAVLDAFLAHGVSPVAYIAPADGIEALIQPGVSTHPDHLAVLAPRSETVDLHETIGERSILAFSVLGVERERLIAIDAAVHPFAAPVLSADYAYGNHNLAVTPRGVSKWQGVLAYCEWQGLDPAGVLAIGDDDNDAELLRNARIGLAMAHAPAAVRAAADHVVDRWSALLDHL